MKKMVKRWLSMLMVVLMTIAMVPMQAFALEGDLNISVRVFDESANIIYDMEKTDTVNTGDPSMVQSVNYTIPAISKFLPEGATVGRVTKVTGSWYPSSGTSKNVGSVVEFGTNNRNQSITYYVTSFNPKSTGGGGASGSEDVIINNGDKYSMNCTVVYHSNYPGGSDYTKTYVYKVSAGYNVTMYGVTLKKLEDCGFNEPNEYSFKEWNTEKNGTGSSANYYNLQKGQTIHVYAQYTPTGGTSATPVTLTYMDGTQKIGEQDYFVGDDVTVIGLDNKENIEFLGWSTDSAATNVDYEKNEEFTITEDTILYAVWEETGTNPTNPTDPATEYTITYKNGETVVETVTVPAGGDADVREAITDGEKEFSYWLGDDGNIYHPGDEITGIDKNYVLTAVWKGEEPDPSRPKENKPGIDKKVDNADRTVVNPDDTVHFTLESNVPDNLSDYVDWQADPWNIVNPSTGNGGTGDAENQESSVNAALAAAVVVNGGVSAQSTETNENNEITKGSYVLTFHDVMSEGLTMNDDLRVTIDSNELSLAAGDYTFTTSNGDGCSFEISMDLVHLFNNRKFELNTETEVRKILVTYSAVYSGEEGSEGDGFKSTNKAWVDYEDKNPDDPDTPDEVEVVTGSITVIKIDQDTREALEGAEFELYLDEQGTQQVGQTVTTDAEGKASFTGLKAGTYYLKETKAPDGYVGQEGLQMVTITEKDGEYLVTYEVPNKYVPHTGGAGTRMFTILGLAIMAGAGVAFVISRRKRED